MFHVLNHHSYRNQEVLNEFGADTKVAQQQPKSFQCHYLSKHLITTASGDRKKKTQYMLHVAQHNYYRNRSLYDPLVL